MTNGTFRRILAFGLAVALLTAFLITTLSYGISKKDTESNLKTIGYIVASDFNNSGEYIIDNVNKINGVGITVVSPSGDVIFDNRVEANITENHLQRREVREAFEKGEGSAERVSSISKEKTKYFALKLNDGNVLRVSQRQPSIKELLLDSVPFLGGIFIIILIMSFVISFAITKRLVRKIESVGNNLDGIADNCPYVELEPFAKNVREQRKKNELLDKQKKQFTANFSHELKTPLTSIAGYAELIENGMARQEDIKPFAHTIREQALRLVTLAEDIIQLSQLEEMENTVSFDKVNLLERAQNCAETLSVNALNKNIKISAGGEDVIVMANKSLIDEMLYNLCENSIRYNKENGSVNISVGIKDNKAFVKVSDTGIGIPEKYKNRVFERFFRVDKSRSKETGGTGLGLAIVKHIAEVHNADIEITSKENEGTSICIVFNEHFDSKMS